MSSLSRFFCPIAATLILSLPLSAALLVAPSGSDIVASASADDDVFGPFNLNLSFTFYGGAPVTQVTLSSNGNLQFGTTDHTFSNQSLPYSLALVAPFWDDFLIPQGDIRYNNSVANQFTAIWNSVGLFGVPGEVNAELILLAAGNGFGYAANSIIVSYGTLTNTHDNDVTAGLTDGASLRTCLPGGAADCRFTTDQMLALQNRAFLFTPTIGSAPGYSVSEINGSEVPEPSGFVLAGLGLVMCMAMAEVIRRKRANEAAH
jgi:hypothetical protein